MYYYVVREKEPKKIEFHKFNEKWTPEQEKARKYNTRDYAMKAKEFAMKYYDGTMRVLSAWEVSRAQQVGLNNV